MEHAMQVPNVVIDEAKELATVCPVDPAFRCTSRKRRRQLRGETRTVSSQ
jgi:hypothetical protein